MSILDCELLNVLDAARAAGISRSKLYEFIRSRELRSVKIGKRRLVRVEALRAWIASKER